MTRTTNAGATRKLLMNAMYGRSERGKDDWFLEKIVQLIERHHLRLTAVSWEERLQLWFAQGPTVTVFHTGTVRLQGTSTHLAEGFKVDLEEIINNKVHYELTQKLLRGPC
jgi:hypothetical protein